MAKGDRKIITEATVRMLTGKEIADLSWERCPNKGVWNGIPYEIHAVDGWTSCLVHGFERMHVCTDPIISRDPQYKGRRIFRVTRARKDGDAYKVYQHEYSIRDEGDNTPHPQVAGFVINHLKGVRNKKRPGSGDQGKKNKGRNNKQ